MVDKKPLKTSVAKSREPSKDAKSESAKTVKPPAIMPNTIQLKSG